MFLPAPARLRRLLPALALLCLASLAARPAGAGTLTVPAQYPTIQAAINAAANGDTILISDGTYTGPGNVDVDFVGKNVTVTSVNGPATTVIDCGGSSAANHRGFYLHSGETGAVISGLTVQNGYQNTPVSFGQTGAGILITSAGATVSGCVLRNNTAGYGGGLETYNGVGTITVIGCTFTGNVAGSGGAASNVNSSTGTISVADCAFIGNTVTYYGGGLYNINESSGVISVTNCTFTGNAANDCGGVYNSNTGYGAISDTNDILYGDSGPETLEDPNNTFPSTFTNCDVQGGRVGTGNFDAAPLFVSASDLHLQHGSPCLGAGTPNGAPLTTLDGRKRPNPPSIGAYEVVMPTTTTALTSSLNPATYGRSVTFTATVAGAGGTPTGTVTFAIDGAAQAPVPLGGGSAVYSLSSLSGGSHVITAAYSGDALFAPGTSPALTQTINVPHVSPQYVSPTGSDANLGTTAAPKLTIQAAINATLSGDTVIVEDGTYTGPGDVDLDFGGRNVTLTSQHGAASTVIDCNGSANANHRGFYLHSGETNAVISGLTIQNGYEGESNYGNGGGIYNASAGLTLQNCVLKNNTTEGVGGGLCNENYSRSDGILITVTDCTFTGNTAGSGGGMYNEDDSNAIIVTDCTVTGNTAGGEGGGIANTSQGSGTITVMGCIVTSNTETYQYGSGGGLYNFGNSSAPIALTNCVISGNAAGTGGGVHTYVYQGAVVVTNCTCTGNAGGGFLDQDDGSGTITLTNDILYGDTGFEIANASGATSGALVTHCDVQGGYAGTGNLNADPLFVSAADLHLQPVSPCLGAGTASGAPATTLDGKARPNPPSIGAYELSPNATTVTVAGVSGSAGQTVTLSATLRTGAGVPLSGRTLVFFVDDPSVGTAVTNAGGVATKTYTLPATLTAGSHTLTAAFAPSGGYAASSGTATLTVTPAPTTLAASAGSGAPGQTVTLAATLKRTAGGAVLTGETVTFSVDGVPAGTAPTGAGGVAKLAYVIPAGDAVGSAHPVSASFAGDAGSSASSGSATLTVTKYAAGLSVASATGTPGQTVTLSATLKSGTAPLSGRTVTFTIDGAAVGTGVTNASGLATLAYAIPAGASVGPHPITASFAGDASYLAALGKGTLSVKNATALAVTNAAGMHGTSVTLSVTLTAGGAASSGQTVTFKVNGASAGTAVTSASGVASVTYAIPTGAKVGSLPIAASFAGDAADNAATGAGTLTVS